MKKLLLILFIPLLMGASCNNSFILDGDATKIEETYKNNETIPWEDAINILNSGEVKQVFQSHNLNVELTLENEKVLNTTEPNIDDIFDEINKCAKVCEDITLMTE